ncbi:MAG: hypothetical protein ABI671_14170 [Burkholderiales bacterium]
MDAHIRNKCEAEALAAFVYVANRLGVELTVETTAYKKGGLIEVWQFVTKPEFTQVLTAISPLLTGFLGVWIAAPRPDRQDKAINKKIAAATLEEKQLVIEKARIELQQLTAEHAAPRMYVPTAVAEDVEVDDGGGKVQIKRQVVKAVQVSTVVAKAKVKSVSKQAIAVLAEEPKFAARRSNFYKALLPYDKVTAVGWGVKQPRKRTRELTVEKKDFSKYVLTTNKLPSIVVEEALITIVAPVIDDSDQKWKGIYQGEPISFAMHDKDFKAMVMRREIGFKHGNAIRCRLTIERKLDETGEEVLFGHSVEVVLERIDESGPAETPQGRKQRFYDKHAGAQDKLFDPDKSGEE